MRHLFSTHDAQAEGMTESALRWGLRQGKWFRAAHGVYADGPDPVCALDAARAKVLASRTVARGRLAGVLHDLHGVVRDGWASRLGILPPASVIRLGGLPSTDATHALA